MTKEIWKLSKSEQIVALVALAVSLVARGLALLPACAIDDYGFLVADDVRTELAQGRLGSVLFREVLRRLDALPPASGLVGSIALTLMLVWVGILVCRMWRIERLPVLSGLVVLFICVHPYQAEIFTFRVGLFTCAVALGLAFYGIGTCFHSKRAQIAAVLLVAAALLTYQVVLNYLAMALLFSLVFYLARLYGPGEPVTADSERFGRELRSQVLTLALAVACAALVTLAVPLLFRLPLSQRTTLLKVSEFGTRAMLARKQLGIMFALNEAVLPIATKWLLALTPLAALALAAFRSPAGALKGLFSRRSLPFLLAIAGGLLAALGVVLVLQEWWPVPRVCSQVSIFWAGMFALVFLAVSPRSRRLMLVLSGFIVLSFIGTNNHIFQDQVRLNLRDMAKANRIISRLEALPDFTPTEGVVLVGGQLGYLSPLKTVQGDMNISALFAEWSKLPLLNEVSGYNLQRAPPAVVEKARGYCLTAPKWPSTQAVIRLQQAVGYSTTASIAGTSDPTLYQTEHYSTGSNLTYQFSVPDGSYRVNLKFAEIYCTSAGQRVFDIVLNGTTVYSHLDILAAAGGANIALDLGCPVTVANRQVTVTLVPVVGVATINAIEILQATVPSSFAPIRVNAGGGGYTDSLGQVWSGDTSHDSFAVVCQ
ncbi:MAG: malectin domain-containing carbohydrate-binding protein [Bryobacteraceae bacterium]